MKSRYFKVAICIVIFFSLIGISNLLLRPIYNKIGKEFENVLYSLNQKVQEKAGLSISYDSLSPSILKGITLNGIILVDSESQMQVASIRSLSLFYSVPALLKGDISNAFNTFSLRDVEIEVTEGQNDSWIKKLTKKDAEDSLSEDLEIQVRDAQDLNVELEAKRLFEILEDIDLSLLNEVRVYRLHMLYKASRSYFDGRVNRATFTSAGKGITEARLGGDFDVGIASNKISGSLNLSAAIPKGFEESSAVLRLGNVSASSYRARYLGFIAEYKKRNFSLKMLPGMQNIYTELNVALESGDVNAKVFADNFNLSRLIQTTNRTQLAQSLFAMNFSVDAQADYNINTKKLSYSSSGNVFVPERAIPAKDYADDVLVSYSIHGNENRINISNFKTSGDRYNLSLDGTFNLNTLQPEGNIYVESVILPNGGNISTEIYLEPQSRGFMCFSPQVSFDDNTFTAVMLNVIPSADSWDFIFELSDYAHPEAEKPGQFSLYGSYAPKSSVYQASVSFDTVYIDSLVRLYAFFSDPSLQPLLEGAANFASTYVFTCDGFASGQGADFAYSVPYAFVANTVRDDQMLMLSADGNKEDFRLSRLEFAFAGQRLLMSAESAFMGQGKGRMVNGRIELNEIPYDFTGFFNKDWISIQSEYGFNFTMNTDTSGDEALLTGLFSIMEFPVHLGAKTFSFTNETNFSYTVSNGLNVMIPHFEGRVIDGGSSLNPVVSFSGSIDSGGAMFRNIAYSDDISTLNGYGNVFWLAQGEEFEATTFNFDFSNDTGIENLRFDGELSNPMGTPLTIGSLFSGDLLKTLLVNAVFKMDSLRSQRFVETSRESDSINAEVTVNGELSNPFVTVSVPRAVFTMQNTPLVLSANATLEDMVVNAYDVSLDFGSTQIQSLKANFDIRKFVGNMDFDLETKVLDTKYNTDVFAKIEPLSEVGDGLPDVLSLSVDTGTVIENGHKKKSPFHVGVVKMQDDFLISSSENIGINGSISNYKDVNFKIDNPLPFAASIEGTVTSKEMNLVVSDVNATVSKLLEAADVHVIKVKKGVLSGGFAITGSPSNPYFSGALEIVPAEFHCPKFFTKNAKTDKITLIMLGSQFYTEPTRCMLQRKPVDVTVTVQMNRLSFESLDVGIKTVEENFVPVNMNLSELHAKGDILADLNINLDNSKITVTGDLTVKDTNAEFGATRLNEILAGFVPKSQEEEEDDSRMVDVFINIHMRSRVQISYANFLRGVVVPGSTIDVTYFEDQNRLLLDGDVPIRSGELSYLNTNFYIKEGSIHFSDNDESFDPRITVRAETKTRDDKNENVTVSLRVENQHLSELAPRLTASPAKSEREIMEILGTIITANSENAANFMLATGDYAIQTVFTRKLENALRDFFKFDIFSLRTMVVQNAVKQGMDRSSGGISNPTGNYLDGTTVYIGKYIGDSVFADAMLRLDYDENRVGDKYTLDGLSFKPEIGFELEAPFAKIRWSMSPDFEDLVNLNLVQNTALTLSWKFNF